jgi:hypothetical protein
MQRCPDQWPLGDNALIGPMVDDLPTFGAALHVAEWLAKLRGKPAATPQVVPQDW